MILRTIDAFKVTDLVYQLTRGGPGGTTEVIGVRPEHARVSNEPIPDGVVGRVVRKFRGVAGQYLVAVRLQNHVVWAKTPPTAGQKLEQEVWFSCAPEIVTIFDEAEKAIPTGLVRA